jgi:hypothetical protein
MATANPITATEILDEVIEPLEPSFAHEFARVVLSLSLSDMAQERIRELLRRNNAGNLDKSEKEVLENYLLVGQFIDLLQAKARASLQIRDSSP